MMLEVFNGQSPIIGERVFIHSFGLVIGDVFLGDDSSVWPGAILRGDVHRIHVGSRTNIQDQSVLHVTHRSQYSLDGYNLHIGNDVTIGHRVTCHGCTIGDRVLLGMGSLILDGAVIQSDVMLGAGSLVPPGKVLESGHLYLGTPVKCIRVLSDSELTFLHYSAQHYVKLKNTYLSPVSCDFVKPS
jgi:carbonic anhydrase/acetyltransferase-like protein (isoleucine patch superfamily)